MTRYIRFTLSIVIFFLAGFKSSAAPDSIRLNADFVYRSHKQFTQDLLYQSDSTFQASVSIRCIKAGAGADSILVYRRQTRKLLFKQGVHALSITFLSNPDSSWLHPAFRQIIEKTNTLPAGEYIIYVDISSEKGRSSKSFLRQVDSSLSVHAAPREALNDIYLPQKKRSVLGMEISTGNEALPGGNALSRIGKATKKVDKAFKSKGLTTLHRQVGERDYTDVYYQDWFVGYYEVDLKGSLTDNIESERNRLAGNASSFAKTELENMQSIFSQTRELKKDKDQQEEASGEIGVTGYTSNGQQEYSEEENNYYELRGRLELPVMHIPVSIEGFYTSQDKNRQAKASYIHLHYDAEKAKAELMKLIGGYKSTYEQTVNRGKGLESVYSSYLSQLQGQKGKLGAELVKETGITDVQAGGYNTEGFKQQLQTRLEEKARDTAALLKGADSSGGIGTKAEQAAAAKAKLEKRYAEALEKYRKLEETQQKIDKYRKLLDQYKNTSYFDSALAYSKIKDLENGDETTYKELAKKASDLLPEGKAKTFIAGLTSMDLGIFSKDVSRYTIAGQTIKGLDAGYDFGFFQTDFTVGRTEYISRDGNVDKYTCYSARTKFKPFKDHKATIGYYGYTPSRKMLADEQFFKDVDASMPSFRNPVHIISAGYEAVIQKNIQVEAEAAASLRKQDPQAAKIPFSDKLAYNIKAEGAIPRTPISLLAGYEHSGTAFENNSLPVSMSGTDRYRIASKAVLFRAFLTLGVEYNYLQQQSFASKGGNSRWGFDIKTSSKRYPSFSLSYKPFSTFRSYADTLAIPQRPLTGEVWTGKVSYQIKRIDYTIRFTGVYNKNNSEMDTLNYGSSLFQLGCIYMKDKLTAMVNLGNMSVAGTGLEEGVGKTNFLSVSGGYTLSQQWAVNVGQDFGMAHYGFSKYGANLGVSFRMQKAPLTVRTGLRYSSYQPTEAAAWKSVYGGSLDLQWQFRFKLKE